MNDEQRQMIMDLEKCGEELIELARKLQNAFERRADLMQAYNAVFWGSKPLHAPRGINIPISAENPRGGPDLSAGGPIESEPSHE